MKYSKEMATVETQIWDEDVEPVVSIACITYNHERYLRDTIEGFLMQKTTFPIEIIIHDDASIDKTSSIINEYKERFPELFKIIIQDENQWSKGGGSIYARFVYPKARGKYLAICDGDDYWVDPLKLQKQVDFLEANNDYSMVCTNYSVVDEDRNVIQFLGWEKKSKRKPHISQETVLERFTPQPLTAMVRKIYLDKIRTDIINYRFPNGDLALFAAITDFGPCYFIDEVTGCYRHNRSGVWAEKNNFEQHKMKFTTMKNLLTYFSDDKSAMKSIYKRLNSTTRILSILSFKKADPCSTVKYLYYYFYFKLKSRVLSA